MSRWTWFLIIVLVLAGLTVALLWLLGVFNTTTTSNETEKKEEPITEPLSLTPVPALKEPQAVGRVVYETTPGHRAYPLTVPHNTSQLQFGQFVHVGNELLVSGLGRQQVYRYVWEDQDWSLKQTLQGGTNFGAGMAFNATCAVILETEQQCGAVRYYERSEVGTDFVETYYEVDTVIYKGFLLLQDDIVYIPCYPHGIRSANSRGIQNQLILPHQDIQCFGFIEEVPVAGTEEAVFELKGDDYARLYDQGATSILCVDNAYVLIADAQEETVCVYDTQDELIQRLELPGRESITERCCGFGFSMTYDSEHRLLLVAAPFDSSTVDEGGICIVYQLTSEGMFVPADVVLSPRSTNMGHFGACVSVHEGHWLISQDSTEDQPGECLRIPIVT